MQFSASRTALFYSAMSPADVTKHTKDSLHVVPIGKTDDKKHNGRSFYE